MASKTNLFGGADVWEPNNILPSEGDWRYSFSWYKEGVTYQSYLYPFEVVDLLGTSANLDRAKFHPDYFLDEGFSLSAGIDQIYLRDAVRYLTYDVPPEPLSVYGDLSGVQLVSVLRSYTCPPEPLQLEGALNTIYLRVALITYSNWIPEPLEITANITGVYLR